MRRVVFLAIILAAVGLFQGWFVGLGPTGIASPRPDGKLTDLYVQGLSMGHAYLPEAPGQGPRKYGILDASYYGSHAYLYFGITPFAVLMVPWHLLTGTFLWTGAGLLAFTELGYLLYGCALLLLFGDKRHTPDWLLAAGLLAVVACSGTWPLAAHPEIYELEGACAFACFAGAVASLAAALEGKGRNSLLLACSALLAALTMGCRPNYAPAVGVLVLGIGVRSWRSGGTTAGRVRATLLHCSPVAVVGAALAAWNHLRFGDVSEFGLGYTGFARVHSGLLRFSAANIPYNAHRYLVGGFRLGHYFPFIEGVKEGPIPLPAATHEAVDQLYGCLLVSPALAFALLAPLRGRTLPGLLMLAAAGNLLLLLGFGFGTYRYPADFLGVLSFLSGVGICSIPRLGGRAARIAAMLALAPALLLSAAACICQATAIADETTLLDVKRPRAFARLAGPFNAASYLAEGAFDSGPRAIRLRLVFPRDRTGGVEPLVVTGEAGQQDFVYAYYCGPGDVQVGFESMGHGGPVSAPAKADYGASHTVDISLGSFLPPSGHPLLRGMSASDVSIARDLVEVRIDGNTVLEAAAQLHPVRSRVFYGESPDDAAFGRRFTGRILSVERPLLRDSGLYPQWKPGDFGPIVAEFQISAMPEGTRQPLVSLGYRPGGGMLFVENAPSGRVRLGLQLKDQGPVFGAPFECALGRTHTLEFTAGSLLPPATCGLWPRGVPFGEREAMKRRVRCLLDGREVLGIGLNTPDASPSSVAFGRNAVQQSGVAVSLDGSLIKLARAEW